LVNNTEIYKIEMKAQRGIFRGFKFVPLISTINHEHPIHLPCITYCCAFDIGVIGCGCIPESD
jgi:hypothetical protein